MRAKEFIFENSASKIGRKYQHIEDLVFTNGSVGGLHAIERLEDMSQQGGTIELKWDGSPVVYWGRDQRGRFMLIPKNAWQYLQTGQTTTAQGVNLLMNSPEDIQKFIMGTGKSEAGKEELRLRYAQELSGLWDYFKKVSPERGFIEGGLLFYPGHKPNGQTAMPQLNPETDTYDFTPNITTFHVPRQSALGQRISKAKVMVAATGYYENIGDKTESRYPAAEGLSTTDVIVQGTTYVETAPNFPTETLTQAKAYITRNASLIDRFLAGQPGLKNPGDVLYRFYNQNLRISGVREKFKTWVSENLSEKQAQKIIMDPGLDAVLEAVELLIKSKMNLINALRSGTYGGIKQTKPEGYAQAHPGRRFKSDLPGQFIKFTDPETWVPRKD